MKIHLRSALAKIGYGAVAAGARIPRSKSIADFDQWGRTIDLIKMVDINVCLDVGANRGFFSKHLRMSGYTGHIFSFEPIASDFERIQNMSDGDDKWKALNYALGAEDGTKTFNINTAFGQTVLSSFLPMKSMEVVTANTNVPLRRLDNILPSLTDSIANPRIFLKMDTQGFDLEVVKGASESLSKIFALQSEISVEPLYEDMPHYTESLSHYERLGFRLVDLFVVNRTLDGFILEYDCLMAKNQHAVTDALID